MTDTAPAAERIRDYLRLLPDTEVLGAEIVYSQAFRSPDWPHCDYGLTREDIETLLADHQALLEELDDRDAEARERWIQKQLEETGLRAVDFRNGMHMDIEPAREMCAHWVGAARAMLGDAPNYSETPVEMEVKVGESPERFAFILQRVAFGALTPHEARQKAERERDEARAALERVRKVVAERRAEVAEHEAENPPSAWSDAVTVTCDRIEDALRPKPEPQGIRAQDSAGEARP